jgi:hypothetical protein
MSEVDRLSNSGLYPALPIADKRGSKEDPARQPSGDPRSKESAPEGAGTAATGNHPRPPKSVIDEYA